MNQLTSLTSKCQITLELPNKVADDFQDEVNNLKIIGTDKVGNNICVFDKKYLLVWKFGFRWDN
ncbi:hypothetical protein LBH_0412 [Lactobacillus helveticus H9]|nr:hypothetical protein LBH_0412 [Lactobacillus helveticus H9]